MKDNLEKVQGGVKKGEILLISNGYNAGKSLAQENLKNLWEARMNTKEILESARDALIEASRGLIYWEPQTSVGYLNKNRITEQVVDEILKLQEIIKELENK